MKRFTSLRVLLASLVAAAMTATMVVGVPASAVSSVPASAAPVVEAQTIETERDTSVSGMVVATGESELTFSYGEASDGVVESDGASFTYTPNPGSLGVDSFAVTATDAHGLTGTNTVTVHVVTPILGLLFDGDSVFDVSCDSLTIHYPILRGDYREEDPYQYWFREEGWVNYKRFDAPVEEGGMGAELGVPFYLESGNYDLELDVFGGGEWPPVLHETVDHDSFTIEGCEEPPVNNPPTLEDVSVAVNLGDAPFEFELNGSDEDGDELTYVIDTPANGVLEQVGDTEQFTFTSTSRGESTVEASVSDDTETATAMATFQVTEVITPTAPDFDSETGELVVPSQDGVVYHVNGDPWPPGDVYQVCGTALVQANGVQWVELTGTISWSYQYDCDDHPEPPVPPEELDYLRWGGADRYETAALIASNGGWATGGTVYIATGQDMPDALALSGVSMGVGTAASAVGVTVDGPPTLLVKQGQIPQVTRAALDQLQPSRIVVAGSTAAISAEVERQLGAWAPVERLGGADRYETAAKIATQADHDVVYLASGEVFADALAAGPLSRWTGGAVLLGKQDVLPKVTGDALGQLQPGRLVVVGGSDRVSDSVAQQAATAAGLAGFERLAGADRYETSQVVARAFPQDVPTSTLMLATGVDYPDALTAGAYAGNQGAPVLLTRPNSLPKGTAGAAQHRPAQHQVILTGGETAVSADVFDSLPSLFE